MQFTTGVSEFGLYWNRLVCNLNCIYQTHNLDHTATGIGNNVT